MARREILNRKLNKTRKAYRKTKYRLAKTLAQINAIKNLIRFLKRTSNNSIDINAIPCLLGWSD